MQLDAIIDPEDINKIPRLLALDNDSRGPTLPILTNVVRRLSSLAVNLSPSSVVPFSMTV